jgi:hypothetical protein
MKFSLIVLSSFLALAAIGRSADEPAAKSIPLEKWDTASFEKAFSLKLKSVSPTASPSNYVVVFEHEQTIPEAKVGELRKALYERKTKGASPTVQIVAKDAENVVISSGSFDAPSTITGVQGDAFRVTVMFQLNAADRPAAAAVRMLVSPVEPRNDDKK